MKVKIEEGITEVDVRDLRKSLTENKIAYGIVIKISKASKGLVLYLDSGYKIYIEDAEVED